MNGGPSGFNNAPVTRICVIASAIFSVFLGIKGGSNKLGLSYQDIFRNPRLWKLVLSVFAFSSTPEMMFGLYLLYYFRVFERQIGSNKYSVFILFSVIVSLFFEVFAVTLLQDPLANFLTSGPYGLIFASFVPFYFDIPVSTRFRVVGVHLSDKSFIYLAGVQLLLSSWKRSILPGICGILAGSLYRLNLFGIRKAKFPEFIASFFSRLSWPSTGSPRGATSRNVTGSAPSYAGRHVQANFLIAPIPACRLLPYHHHFLRISFTVFLLSWRSEPEFGFYEQIRFLSLKCQFSVNFWEAQDPRFKELSRPFLFLNLALETINYYL